MKRVNEIDLNNKKVLIRCDFNVPIKDGVILDDTRIVKSLETIKYVLKYASNVIIISHLGRIKTYEDKMKNSLGIVCERLSNLLSEKVKFCTYEEDINSCINNNKIIMLENTRFFDLDNNKESGADDELTKFYASLADIYVFDAFGVSHREAASTMVSKYLPSAVGFLVCNEIDKLSYLFNPDRPFTIIFGGSKVSDKIGIISKLIDKSDSIIVVGAMAYTFLKAKGIDVGNSLVEDEYVPYCLDLIRKYGDKIILPIDIYEADNINSTDKTLVDINNITKMGLDIGPKTVDLIKDNIIKNKCIFVNGPAGVYENSTFEYGTKELFKILENIDAKVIVGGGDSVSAALKYSSENKFYHISTGGGAALEFLEGRDLPAIKNIGE